MSQHDNRTSEPKPAPLDDIEALRLQENAVSLDADESWKAGRSEKLAIACLSIVSLVVALDATILVPVLPTLAATLNGSAIETFWAGTSFLLASSTCQPFIGAVSDIFGRRLLLLISIFLFALGTLVAGLSDDFIQFLAGRTIQGIGGGGIITLVLVICTDIIPLRQRPKFTSYLQISWAVGTVSGPLIGAAFAEYVSWRWIFYVNFPICGIGATLAFFVIRFQDRHKSWASKFSEVDWTGGILFISSTTTFLLGITWGGVQYAWRSYQTLLPVVLGCLGIIGTVYWEFQYAKHPFIRKALFDNISGLSAYTCALSQGLLMYAELFYISFYLLSVQGLSPIMTGVYFIPITAGLIPASMAVGIAISRSGRFRWAIWSGWAVNILGAGILIILDVGTKRYALILIFLVVGLGTGSLLSSLNFGIQAIAKQGDVAYASAMYAFLRGVGMCLGVAIGGTVFQNALSYELRKGGLPAEISPNAEAFVVVLNHYPWNSSFRQQVLQAYSSSFRTVFIVLTAVCGASGIISIFISHYSLDKELVSEHVLQPQRSAEVAAR